MGMGALVNVPVSLVALALTPRLIPESRAERRRASMTWPAPSASPQASRFWPTRCSTKQRRRGLHEDRRPAHLAVALIAAFVVSSCGRGHRWFRSGSFVQTLNGANVVGLLLGASLF